MTAITEADATTALVKLNSDNTGLATDWKDSYPYSLALLVNDIPNLTIGETVFTSELLPLHVAPVIVDEKPTGDVVEIGDVTLEDDGYHQSWTVRAFTEEELEENFNEERDNRLDSIDQLESALRYQTRTFDIKDANEATTSVETTFSTDTMLEWNTMYLSLDSYGDEETLSFYPSLDKEVIASVAEIKAMLKRMYREYNDLLVKLNRHRFSLQTATMETGLPSYPDWIK